MGEEWIFCLLPQCLTETFLVYANQHIFPDTPMMFQWTCDEIAMIKKMEATPGPFHLTKLCSSSFSHIS